MLKTAQVNKEDFRALGESCGRIIEALAGLANLEDGSRPTELEEDANKLNK